MKKFYITTPIYYVNDKPHLGHTYTTVTADVLARYHRLIGEEVFFLTGTDEHGAKIEATAQKAGLSARQFVNEIAASYQLAWDELDISHNRFIRTTEEAHIKAVQQALQFMYDKGDVYKGEYSGLYCPGCEQYKSERDLVNGQCPDHQIVPEKMTEQCYLFRLSKYQAELLKLIKTDKLKILPAVRKNEIINFYQNEGLQDISFSRQYISWGIPLPWDKSQTTYVWADAFLNYLTGLGWNGEIPLNPPSEKGENFSPFSKVRAREGFLTFWPPDVQLIGKDILRVHATIWPAMLLSLGLPLPKLLFVHGFFLIDGQKMSKSLGNVIAPRDLVKRYGADATKYLLLSATPFGQDGDISWQKFDEKYNADLANGLGNLVARVLTMTEKKLAGKLPKINKIMPKELEIKNQYQKLMVDLKLDQALTTIIDFGKDLDNYIEKNKVYKLEGAEAKKHLSILLEALRLLAWYLIPFLPETADRIFTQLGLEPTKEKERSFAKAFLWGGLKEETKIQKGEILFPRVK
jgi:methionyl-tRNA synthetase